MNYSTLDDAALLTLLLTEGDRLPRSAADEVISRGQNVVGALSTIALDPKNWTRSDAGWWAPLHACFLLGAIGGEKVLVPLLDAFDLSVEYDYEWLFEDWPSIFGRLGPGALQGLQDRVLDHAGDDFAIARALQGMAAVASRHPERRAEVFAFIAQVAADDKWELMARAMAGNILLDFRLREHEPLLIHLAGLPGNSGFDADDVREALSKTEPDLTWYQRDWLDFYSPKDIAARQERWESDRLSVEDAWVEAMAELAEEEGAVPLLSSKKAAKKLGEHLALAQRIEDSIHAWPEDATKEELLVQAGLAQELYALVRVDRGLFRLFESYSEALTDWLTSLPVNLAGCELIDEALLHCDSWANIRAPGDFLGERAVILAQAGREAEAKTQISQNLKIFGRELWVRIKAGDAWAALKDVKEAEKVYRLCRSLAPTEDDRSIIDERIVKLYREAGRTAEADALETAIRARFEEERSRYRGTYGGVQTIVRPGPKVGRNDPCPCGSGKKHKKCCLGKA